MGPNFPGYLCSSWKDLVVCRAPAGKERDLFPVSVPAVDLLCDLISLLCFPSLAKNISSPKKQPFSLLFWSTAGLRALGALYSCRSS